MPTFRPDILAINPYVPGRSIDEVAREIGMARADIVKLASNESPDGPFPGVINAAVEVLAESNRYPDPDTVDLKVALSGWLEVPRDHLWTGNGSVALLTHVAVAVGGPKTSAVYGWPSFVMYRIASKWAMTELIEVPLATGQVHDLDAMRGAVRDDTTIVYVCNPNNPTGTIVPASAVTDLVESLPDSVLVVIDEAYHDFVTDPSYATAIPHALSRPNVIVLRTFSKIFGLAAMRVGYAVGTPETLAELRRAQAPFSVSQVAQAAAAASLGNGGEIRRRQVANSAGRRHLTGVLAERGLEHTDSQANFVWFRLGEDSAGSANEFARRGVIVRPMSRGWLRVTVGHQNENEQFVAALDEVSSGIRPDLA
jgi:histidinol-phosphate aminotransferase